MSFLTQASPYLHVPQLSVRLSLRRFRWIRAPWLRRTIPAWDNKRPWLCHSAAIACPESSQKRRRLIRGVFLCVRALLDITYYRLTSRKGRSSACSVSQLQVPFVQKFKSIFLWLNTYVHEIRGIIASGTLLGILSTPLD